MDWLLFLILPHYVVDVQHEQWDSPRIFCTGSGFTPREEINHA